ncbi:uncharacterized protein BX663DRAFT_527580 [Cokeromyces recurvatus]|uniref:uncharacterized protein n=1 Tax=Cokeromyces recurvatus TaxID=90255 RepID=UPI00221F7746|nr:uncharacterized protein BX663DRAFT_527580 [Cokeromyces recurvatus]KAI7897688.1 hypothetical protein BX663DRAFT_527580 [Cokeromyces recurvatus]
MQLNRAHIKNSPIVLISFIMSVIGWFITFIGACIAGRGGVIWWIIIYELLLVGSILFSIWRQVFHHYQLMFLVFLGVSIALLTIYIDQLLFFHSSGDQATSAGAIILIIIEFFWVILFGSTEDSFVNQFIYSQFTVNTNNTVNRVQIHTSPKESKVALSSPEHPPSSIHIVSPIMMPQPTITVTALHPYTANPEDPNELSFAKDEVLEILNKSGNWWQAKKRDGTIGIVPSNYFAP